MAIRYKALTELYQETQRKVTAPAEWQQFLTSACRNYRLSFDEQLLVYRQRTSSLYIYYDRLILRSAARGNSGAAMGLRISGRSHTVHFCAEGMALGT